ncbi:UNVERIFIED_CONTAM: hypothetical protein Sradi_2969700 [Sesamum radiatum]|uniref:Uncharacterized protein n=1 Tax=Sesamum radiatum TaxID=300843 RepID=A0AAW2S023_SESRA
MSLEEERSSQASQPANSLREEEELEREDTELNEENKVLLAAKGIIIPASRMPHDIEMPPMIHYH